MRRRRAEFLERLLCRSGVWLLAAPLLSVAGGCLSLGGKTTYVQNTPETEARIAGLETRVGALEQAVVTRSTPSIHFDSGEPIVTPPISPRPPYGQ